MSLRRIVGEEKRQLLAGLAEGYGFDAEALEQYETLEYGKEIWAVSSTVIALPLRKMRVESVGILLARESTPTVASLQLFARPGQGTIDLDEGDASAFIDRKPVAVNVPDGIHVVFYRGIALDLGYAKTGRLTRIKSKHD